MNCAENRTTVPGELPVFVVADIESADFVAIRLEAPGGPLCPSAGTRAVPETPLELGDFYRASAEGAAGALPTRLGVCCCRWQPAIGSWELRSHELDLWPGGCLDMLPSVSARRIHLAKEAAKRATVDEAGPEGSPQKRRRTRVSRWADQLVCSTQWVVAALHEVARRRGCAVLVHDGLSDLLQIHDKFISDVPEGHLEFGRACLELFPNIFDTHVLEKELMPEESPPLETATKDNLRQGLHSLETTLQRALGFHQASTAGAAPKFKELGLFTHRASAARLGLVSGGGAGAAARAAMAVAELFLLQVDIAAMAQEALPKYRGKRQKFNEVDASHEEKLLSMSCSISSGNSDPGFPVARRKRKRSALDEAVLFTRSMEVAAQRLAGCRQEHPDLSGPDFTATEPVSVGASARRAVLRRFLNRVAAAGTHAGYLRLDTLIQVQLVKWMRKQQSVEAGDVVRSEAGDVARSLFSKEESADQ